MDKVELLVKQMEEFELDMYNYLRSKIERNSIGGLVNLNHPYFVDHGKKHSERVIENFGNMLPKKIIKNLSSAEVYILLCSAWLHDWGMMVKLGGEEKISDQKKRDKHHQRSKDFIMGFGEEALGMDGNYSQIIANVCLCHSRKVSIKDIMFQNENIYGHKVRGQFISALLRLGDAFDVDSRRAPELNKKYVIDLPYQSRKHWKACELVNGVDFFPDNSEIILNAILESAEDRNLLVWKLLDLYDELKSVFEIINKYKLSYTSLLCQAKNPHENSKIKLEAAEEERRVQKQIEKYPNRKRKFFEELSELWGGSGKDKEKLFSETKELYKSYFQELQHYRTTSKLYPSENVLFLKEEHKIKYLQDCRDNKHISRTTLKFNVVNISPKPIDALYVHFEGALPVEEKESLALNIIGGKVEQEFDSLNYELVTNKPGNKRIKVIPESPLEPGEEFFYETTYDWPYPVAETNRLRWYSAYPESFRVNLKLEILLPPEAYAEMAEIRKEGPMPNTFEEVLNEIQTERSDDKCVLKWKSKICDAFYTYKLYFKTHF